MNSIWKKYLNSKIKSRVTFYTLLYVLFLCVGENNYNNKKKHNLLLLIVHKTVANKQIKYTDMKLALNR